MSGPCPRRAPPAPPPPRARGRARPRWPRPGARSWPGDRPRHRPSCATWIECTVQLMTHPLAGPGIEVTTEQTAQALTEGTAQVVDVREPYERETGHIAGTRHIELERLASQAQTRDPGRAVSLLCRVGPRPPRSAR